MACRCACRGWHHCDYILIKIHTPKKACEHARGSFSFMKIVEIKSDLRDFAYSCVNEQEKMFFLKLSSKRRQTKKSML